jgi:hypothetical protein
LLALLRVDATPAKASLLSSLLNEPEEEVTTEEDYSYAEWLDSYYADYGGEDANTDASTEPMPTNNGFYDYNYEVTLPSVEGSVYEDTYYDTTYIDYDYTSAEEVDVVLPVSIAKPTSKPTTKPPTEQPTAKPAVEATPVAQPNFRNGPQELTKDQQKAFFSENMGGAGAPSSSMLKSFVDSMVTYTRTNVHVDRIGIHTHTHSH